MRTVANISTQINDCRQLKLEVRFFSLCEEQADQLAKEYYQFINENFKSCCVLDWFFRDRAFDDLDFSLKKRKMKNGAYDFLFNGYLTSDRIYNKTTLRRFERQIDRAFLTPCRGTRYSVDFLDYYNAMVLSERNDPEQFKIALLNLFNLEGRIYQGEILCSDMQGLFSCAPLTAAEKLFYGSFNLDISCYTLWEELDYWANRLFDFGKKLSERFQNINVYVDLNNRATPYTDYYGQYVNSSAPIFQRSFLRNYLCYFYNTEIGWGHIICDKTRKLGLNLIANADDNGISSEEIRGGAIAIKSTVPISTYSISDRKTMKKCIYKTVMPRENTINLEWKLRRYWEYVPVFENELFITDQGVKFKHYGEIELEYICRALSVDPNKLR